MKTRHGLVLTVLGAIFIVLVVFLVISWTQGDESNHGGAGMRAVHSSGLDFDPSGSPSPRTALLG